MLIISFQNELNNFLTFQCELLKINLKIYKDLNDLEDKIGEIDNDFLFILSKYSALNEDFVRNIENIKNINQNTILSYTNINVNKNDNQLFLDFNNLHDIKKFIESNIDFLGVKKTTLETVLKNKENDSYKKMTLNIEYNKISSKNFSQSVQILNNIIIDYSNKIFLKNYRNLERLDYIKKDIPLYYKFCKDNILKNNKNNVIKLFNEINDCNLSYIFITSNTSNILKKILDTEFNNIYNKIYIFEDVPKLDKLKCNIEKINFSDLNKIFNKMEFNWDCMFLNNEEQIVNDRESYFIVDLKNQSVLKINSLYLKFLSEEFQTIDEFQSYLVKFTLKYFPDEVLIKNKPISLNSLSTPKPNLYLNLIDDLYDNNLYDECSLLINFLIRNNIILVKGLVFKFLSIMDKLNFYVSEKDVNGLLTLFKINDFDEVFKICIVLIAKKLEKLAGNIFINCFIPSYKNIKENKIIETLILFDLLDILNQNIDIDADKIYIDFLISNLDFIKNNYNSIQEINDKSKPKKIYTSILLFLNTRLSFISNEDDKNKILESVSDFLGVNLNRLDVVDENKFLKIIQEYPILVKNSVNCLSDFMLSSEDIKLKRDNLLIFTRIVLKNWDHLAPKIKKEVNNGMDFGLDNLFQYAYHGIPNKELFENCIKITRNTLKLTLDKKYLEYNYNKSSKKKIAFISDFLTRRHSVFKDRHKVIEYLSKKEDFEVYIITFGGLKGIQQINAFKNIKEHIILKNMNFINIIKYLRTFEFDKLVFCEIGMDSLMKKLAHFRIANKQYNTWGHSDTSGYEEIDYFVSSELYELPYEESKNHYTEKLILQKGMCTSYVNPTKDYDFKLDRNYYGLSEYEKIVLCPQSLFKIHPDFDLYLFEILYRNPNSSIVLLNNDRKSKMYDRWDNVLKNYPKYFGVLSRVKFVPPQSHQNFVNLMKCADILIDPYPFGGCNSSLESFSLFKPLVTQPSIRINGRFTYGFYNKMDMKDMIAYNMEEYVDITTKLLNDKEFYDKQVNLLKERSDILFEDQETLKEWEELMSE